MLMNATYPHIYIHRACVLHDRVDREDCPATVLSDDRIKEAAPRSLDRAVKRGGEGFSPGCNAYREGDPGLAAVERSAEGFLSSPHQEQQSYT